MTAEAKIKNFEELAKTEGRRFVLEIAEAGLQAIDTRKVVLDTVRLEGNALVVRGEATPLDGVRRILVCGAGKCAAAAAAVLEEILGDRISGGVVLAVGEVPPLRRIAVYRGTHPMPSEENVKGAKALVESLEGLSENDLVIFLTTGGGSTLLCLPDGPSGYLEEGAIFKALTNAGATIQEINTVRKHLSLARGGFIAKYAFPARVVSLIFSDVPGDNAQFIASGPTIKDATTVGDAEAVLRKYGALAACRDGRCGLVETPKEDKYFERVKNIVAVSSKTAIQAMSAKAVELGLRAEVCPDCLSGEARDAGVSVMRMLETQAPRTALICGGETTVTMHGEGYGGRNQEVALSCLHLVGDDRVVLAAASDGRDNTEFGGAICDRLTAARARELGLDPDLYLDGHRSYEFFSATGDYLMMGDTGSNVSDLVVAIRD